MIITPENASILNSRDFYIHDDVLLRLAYDRAVSILTAEMNKDGAERDPYSICFRNVAGMYLSDCGFWGRSPHVLDFIYVEDGGPLLARLREQRKEPPVGTCKRLGDGALMEVRMVFTSGDVLEVVCGSIEAVRRDLDQRLIRTGGAERESAFAEIKTGPGK